MCSMGCNCWIDGFACGAVGIALGIFILASFISLVRSKIGL